MEKKQLLIISKDREFVSGLKTSAGSSFEITSVQNIHAGYTLALGYLPDAILIDHHSLASESLKNLPSFKSTHFLNKSFLFLYGEKSRSREISDIYKDHVDEIFFNDLKEEDLLQKMDDAISVKRCLSNYWKDSFMGLFNLLSHPVVLLQNEEIVAMNDSFKKYFFVTSPGQLKITDIVDCRNKYQLLETLRNFARGKHMKATTKTSLLLMNNKIREATITFSKLDMDLTGQMVMMINFAEKEIPINENIGTCSVETEQYFTRNNSLESFSFTKREKEIIGLLCKGYKTKEISEALCISAKTIEKHRSNIIKRTNSDTILESIVYALNHKMIEI